MNVCTWSEYEYVVFPSKLDANVLSSSIWTSMSDREHTDSEATRTMVRVLKPSNSYHAKGLENPHSLRQLLRAP